jgi:AraC-like DNA-binding protein
LPDRADGTNRITTSNTTAPPANRRNAATSCGTDATAALDAANALAHSRTATTTETHERMRSTVRRLGAGRLERASAHQRSRNRPHTGDVDDRGWVRYWRAPDLTVEAMHANLWGAPYQRHSHETYSFGVTERGAQAFSCRGSSHVSATGLVMLFNPDEPHDGRDAAESGFTYRIVHLHPDLVAELLAELPGPRKGLPLFTEPVVDDPRLAGSLRQLHRALTGPVLRRDEHLMNVVAALAHHCPVGSADPRPAWLDPAVRAARDLLHAEPTVDHTAADLARVAGVSRFAVYRAFRASMGVSPSEYQRQLRLRRARGLLASGRPPSLVAAEAGFADQAHLNRWFTRHYGITPGTFQRAGSVPTAS